MARVKILPIAAFIDAVDFTLKTAAGASATVKLRNTDGTSGANATVYSGPTGSGTVSQPITVPTDGTLNGWVFPGRYNVVFTGLPGTITQAWDAPSPDSIFTSVKDFGAVGNGSTDDVVSIQAGLDYIAANGGTLFFPPGTYKVTSTLHFDSSQSKAATIRGSGGGAQFAMLPSRILYTGVTGGVRGGALTLNSSTAWELAYLAFDYSNASFAGHIVNVDGSDGVSSGGDSQSWHIHHCTTKCTSASAPYGTATSGFRFSRAIIGTINNCHFTGADHGLLFGDAGGAYVNVVTVADCTFNTCTTAHIAVGSGDAEGIYIRGCTFEAGSTPTPGVLGLTGNQIYSMSISDCWFGDASGAYTAIDGLQGFSSRAIGMFNNYFAGSGAGPMIRFGKAGSGWGAVYTVMNNTFNGNGGTWFALADAASLYTITMIGNSFVGSSVPWSGSPPDFYYALGNTVDFIYDRQQRIELDAAIEVENTLGNVAKTGFIVAGGSTATSGTQATLPGTTIGALYRASDQVRTVVQSPNISSGEVVLAAGTGSPTPGIRVQAGNKLSFYNATPVVKPTITGSRGGNVAVAILLAALASQGLIIDSTTA